MIAIGECAQFIVLGPIVAELAPPHLLGRYMSLYGLSFMAGVALGPAVGGALLATSPDAVWWGGALALAVTGPACCDSATGYPTRSCTRNALRRKPSAPPIPAEASGAQPGHRRLGSELPGSGSRRR